MPLAHLSSDDRNMFRGSPQTFATDAKALAWANELVVGVLSLPMPFPPHCLCSTRTMYPSLPLQQPVHHWL